MEEKKIILGHLKSQDEAAWRELALVLGERGYVELRLDNQNSSYITEISGGLRNIKKAYLSADSKIKKTPKSVLFEIDNAIEASTELMDAIDNTSYWKMRGVITEREASQLNALRLVVAKRAWKKITDLLEG